MSAEGIRVARSFDAGRDTRAHAGFALRRSSRAMCEVVAQRGRSNPASAARESLGDFAEARPSGSHVRQRHPKHKPRRRLYTAGRTGSRSGGCRSAWSRGRPRSSSLAESSPRAHAREKDRMRATPSRFAIGAAAATSVRGPAATLEPESVRLAGCRYRLAERRWHADRCASILGAA